MLEMLLSALCLVVLPLLIALLFASLVRMLLLSASAVKALLSTKGTEEIFGFEAELTAEHYRQKRTSKSSVNRRS
jgi:hypothetical protein